MLTVHRGNTLLQSLPSEELLCEPAPSFTGLAGCVYLIGLRQRIELAG
jgi:hypothetical protein